MPLPSSDEFYRIQKLPPYVFAVINELRDKARAAGEDIIDMGMGNPDGATPDLVVEKMLEQVPNPLNHRYSVSRGIPALREAIVARYAKQYGVHLDVDSEAIVTIGANEALGDYGRGRCTYASHAGCPYVPGRFARPLSIANTETESNSNFFPA